MAIDIKFDLVGNPEPPTIVLANRNGNKLGQLKVNTESIDLSDKFNDASEISFTVNKYIDDEIVPLWDKIVDFKLIYCKEWDIWFEIRVELDEETESVKTVFGTQLGYAELSQVMLYNIEINTEKDIERDNYKITILYDPQDSKASLLDRMFEKAPHYSIAHVDYTIANIQRSFSFDNTSIADACQEVAEEIGCLFVFHSNSDEKGIPQRTVSVYDLYQNCNNKNCKHRGEYTDVCPKCGSTDIKYGYGDDTLIFVTADELATNGIQLVTDTDAVKNCFKLEAGDDLMTATVRNCNPNGTDYIWHFSDTSKEDMSNELVAKLESYDELYRHYYNDYVVDLDTDHVTKYNKLVDKYLKYNEDLQKIAMPIKGYASLMNAYYNVIDLGWYLKSGLMPSVEMSKTTASDQAKLLTTSSLSPVAVGDASIASEATANSAVLGMARVIVKSTYKVQIKSSEYNKDTKTWRGIFTITNYSDDEDTVDTSSVSVKINDDLESFIKQKINKELNKEDTEDLSITGLFKKEGTNFSNALKEYALVPLTSFRDACQSCLDIMIDQGIANPKNGVDLYTNLYLPYYNKLLAIEAEMKVREEEIHIISGKYNLSDILVREGLQQKIEKHRDVIQKALNFQKYIGDELWLEFCTFRREDTYSNDNYISDGLNNAELFKKALEFYVAAENEIYKSAELQHSISSTLNNLLAIEKFEPLVKSFKVGNWLRVRIDEKIFKLRLLEYEIDFGDFDNISVEFSDVTKIRNGITDIESILSQASSMATSYGAVMKQADKGNEARSTILDWLNEGLNSALVQIQNNVNEDIVIDKNGLLGRSYSEITEQYSPEQFRLTHNIMAYTDDDWKTVRQAIGKHQYKEYDKGINNFKDKVGYGMSADFVTAGIISGSQIVGGDIYSANYQSGVGGTHLNLTAGDFDFAGGKIIYVSKDDKLTLKDVTIEWANTNTPDITVKDISGFEDYLKQLEDLKNQIDGRAQTWYQDTDPSENWTTDEDKALHVGDLWHYTGETIYWGDTIFIAKDSEYVWQLKDGIYQWIPIEISDEVFDIIDGKAQIFTSQPVPPYNVGDLWVQGDSGDIKHCIYSRTENESFNQADWTKSSKYTDDTAADEIVSGIGATKIDGKYVISPHIIGGDLEIVGTSGTSAKISSDGVLTATGANITGAIHATSLTLGEDIKIPSTYISGLPTFDEFGDIDVSNIVYKGDITQSTKIDSNGISYLETTVPTANGNVTYTTYNAGDYMIFGGSKGVDTDDKKASFFKVSTDGLLQANNAIIYGTIYATDGSFTGTISSKIGDIGGWIIDDGNIHSVAEVEDYGGYVTLSSGSYSTSDNAILSIGATTILGDDDRFRIDLKGHIRIGKEDAIHTIYSGDGFEIKNENKTRFSIGSQTYFINNTEYIAIQTTLDANQGWEFYDSGSNQILTMKPNGDIYAGQFYSNNPDGNNNNTINKFAGFTHYRKTKFDGFNESTWSGALGIGIYDSKPSDATNYTKPTIALELKNSDNKIRARLDVMESDYSKHTVDLLGIWQSDNGNMTYSKRLSLGTTNLSWEGVVVAQDVSTSSTEDIKTNIVEANSVLSCFKPESSTIYTYNYIEQNNTPKEDNGETNISGDDSELSFETSSLPSEEITIAEKTSYGFVIGDGYSTPQEVLSSDGKHISLYSMASLNWKATQELYAMLLSAQAKIEELESKIIGE